MGESQQAESGFNCDAQANHVGISPSQNRSGSTGEVGEGEGEKSGLRCRPKPSLSTLLNYAA
jgi:hypothetical protein